MNKGMYDDYETCRYCGAQGERGSGAVCHSPWRAERCHQPPHDDEDGHAPEPGKDDDE